MSDVSGQNDVTKLLSQWRQGDPTALDAVTRLVYSELHKIAASCLKGDSEHTLQPTALINEVYLRLIREDHLSFENRKRFFAFSARLMRQVLTDHARAASSAKRGGDLAKVPLADAVSLVPGDGQRYLALNQALDKLAIISPRKAHVIELRYFAGLKLEEAAEVLELSPATVSREQRMAEAWLNQSMTESVASPSS